MIKLNSETNSLFGTDGSGNQKKCWIGNHLIKIDSKYREAKKEESASKLASLWQLDHASYEYVKVLYDGKECSACKTPSFLERNDSEISAAEILDIFGVHIDQNLPAIDFINIMIQSISDFTDLDKREVTRWLYTILVFDFIIANNDRHLTNFGVIENNGRFRLTPIYDNGQSFFGTDRILTLNELKICDHKFKSRPFGTNPIKNLGDLLMTKSIFDELMLRGSLSDIRNLDILEGHKVTIIHRTKLLQGVLDTIRRVEEAEEIHVFS